MGGYKWTESKIFELNTLAGKHTQDQIAKIMGISHLRVKNRMSRDNLSNRPDGLTIPQVALEYGCSVTRVRNMIDRNQLTATRISKESAWCVDPDDIGPEEEKLLRAPKETWTGPVNHPPMRFSAGEQRWTLPDTRIEMPWGYSVPIDARSRILYIRSGHRTSLHIHKDKDESLCLIQGRALLVNRKETTQMMIGQSYEVPSKTRHRITAVQPVIIVVSDSVVDDSIGRIEDDYGRTIVEVRLPMNGAPTNGSLHMSSIG
jgi:hypothetical protein